jgi:hypothetical protein
VANDFLKQLKASKKAYQAAKKRVFEERGKSGAPEFEDGIYLARLQSAELGEWNGNLKVLFKWKFVDGDYDGQVVHDYQGIGSEDNLFYFGRRIEQFGYEMPDDPTEIPELLKSIVDEKKMCKIRLRTKGDYQNVWLNKVLDDGEEAEDADDAADDTELDDDAPEEKLVKGKGKKGKKEEPAEEEEEEESEDEEEESEEEEEEEEEAEEEEGEDVELEVGMKVVATTSKGERKGEVIDILAKEGLVRVKTEDNKVVKVKVENVAFDEAPEDEEEEAPEPPKKTGKKTDSAKTGKKR